MSAPYLTEVNPEAELTTAPIKANDNGSKTVFINHAASKGKPSSVLVRLPDDMTMPFPIRPDNKPESQFTGIGEKDRFNMTLRIDSVEHAELQSKLEELDGWALDQGHSKLGNPKEQWFAIDTKDKKGNALAPEMVKAMLSGKQRSVIKEGGTSKSGDKYPNAVNAKVDGWGSYVTEVVWEEKELKGLKQRVISHLVFRDRLVSEGPVSDRDTRFYLHLPSSGKYTDKVPVVDGSNKPVTGPDGKIVWRWVGPQDCKPYSKVSAVIALSKIYVSAEFGITLAAKQVYIKPAPPKTSLNAENVEDDVDADAALAALGLGAGAAAAAAGGGGGGAASTPVANTPAASMQVFAGEGEDAASTSAAAGEAAAPLDLPSSERVGRKRTAAARDEEESTSKPKSSKKSKAAATLSDDF